MIRQIVIDLMLSSVLSNNAAQERMRSISFSGPEKLSDDKCFDIFFVPDSKGIIWVWRFRSLASKPQELPTIDLNVQHASMFTTSAFSICMCYLSLRITHFSTVGSRLILGMGRVGRADLWMVLTKWIQLNTDKPLQFCWCNFVSMVLGFSGNPIAHLFILNRTGSHLVRAMNLLTRDLSNLVAVCFFTVLGCTWSLQSHRYSVVDGTRISEKGKNNLTRYTRILSPFSERWDIDMLNGNWKLWTAHTANYKLKLIFIQPLWKNLTFYTTSYS